MIRRTRVFITLGSTCVATATAAAALMPVDVQAAPSTSAATMRVIVLLKAGAGAVGHTDADRIAHAAAVTIRQRPVAAQIEAGGGRVSQRYSLINAMAATVRPATVSALLARSDVAAVVPDRLVRVRQSGTRLPQPTVRRVGAGVLTRALTTSDGAGPQTLPKLNPTVCPTDPAKPLLEPEALTLMRAASDDPSTPNAAQYATGAGVRVGVIANAVDTDNPDLIRADGTPVVSTYKDFAGTGTDAPANAFEAMGDVASIAAQGRSTYDLSALGATPAGCTIRVRGVAPGADVIALKALDGDYYYDSSIVESIDYAVTVGHVDVLNESFSGDQYPDNGDDPVSLANAAAVAAGVTITAITGDAGPNSALGPPATQLPGADGVITLGATTQLQLEKQFGYYRASRTVYSGDIANLSSYGVAQTGRTVDAVAPGYLAWSICTDDPAKYLDCPDLPAGTKGLSLFGGTSESGPLTAGVAALVIQRYRMTHHGASPTPQLVKRIITSTADDIGAPAQEQGAGQVDALRAVQLAGAIAGGSSATDDVLTSPNARTVVVGQNAQTHTSVHLTNPSAVTRRIVVARRAPTLTSVSRHTVSIPTEHFAAQPFSVAPGTDRFAVTADLSSGGGDYPDLELIDPNGNVANETNSEGLTNTLILEADHPVPGVWQLFVITYAYTGPVAVTVRSYRNVSVELAHLSIPPRTTRTVTIPVRGSAGAGDDAFAATITNATAGTLLTSIPVVVRTIVSLRTGVGSFRGVLNGGNGRGAVLAGSATFLLRVPARSPDLHVAIQLDQPGQHVDAYLIAPTGDAIDQQTTLAPGSADPAKAAAEIDLSAVHPRTGLWRVVIGVMGPLLGDVGQIAYTGRVTLAADPITAAGLPTSVQTTLTAGATRHILVHVVNASSASHAYIVDPRLISTSVLTLTGPASVPVSAADPLPVATVSVPPDTSEVTATMTAGRAIAGSVAPNNFSFAGSNSDPEAYDVSAAGTLRLVIRSPELANGPWVELPTVAGPFGAVGLTTPFAVALKTIIRTRSFDPSVTSATGDPWPASVGAPQIVTPVTIPAHGSADVAVSISPTAAPNSVVVGTLFVDTWDSRTGVSGQQTALPYRYRVA